jgi:Lipocalin-like domain
MKYSKFFGGIVLLCTLSCTDAKNNKLIIGKWQGVQWQSNGKDLARNIESTSFSFDDKAAYQFDNAGTTEKGTYKVENESLYTTPEKGIEIMVKILKLTNDSLVFGMNNGGQEEILTLKKK